MCLLLYGAFLSILGNIPGHAYLPIVQTVHGIIQGRTVKSKDGRFSHQYLGIPYAAPPIGRLRFQKPKPYAGQWSGKYSSYRAQHGCTANRIYGISKFMYLLDLLRHKNMHHPYSWVSLGYFAVNLSGGQPKMY